MIYSTDYCIIPLLLLVQDSSLFNSDLYKNEYEIVRETTNNAPQRFYVFCQ